MSKINYKSIDRAIVGTLLGASEGERIKFKEAKTTFEFDRLVTYACTVANCGGGKLVSLGRFLPQSEIVFE
jgi:hypothetical protein